MDAQDIAARLRAEALATVDQVFGNPDFEFHVADVGALLHPPPHGLPTRGAHRPHAENPRPAAAENFNRWPDVPPIMPPSSFENILDNTSLAEPTLPPLRESRYPVSQETIQRRRVMQEEATETRRLRQQDADEQATIARRSERANKASDELRTHYSTLKPLAEDFAQALSRFKTEDKAAFDLLAKHAANARVVSTTDVR